MAQLTNQSEQNISSFLPYTHLSCRFLIACCSVAKCGLVEFILQKELMCELYMQEYAYVKSVQMGHHPRRIPFTSGLKMTQKGGKESKQQIFTQHSILVKRWVLGINLSPAS